MYYIIVLILTISCSGLSTISQNNNQLDDDESNLWKLASKEERVLNSSDLILVDDSLDLYLNSILEKLGSKSFSKLLKFNVKVIKNPYLNAFTFPSGQIYIHTGLLAEIKNEAQLATLLAHEMSHAILRHAIRQKRDFETKASIFSIFSFGTAGLNPLAGSMARLFGVVAANLSISGYSKSNEYEADEHGLKLMVGSGYDPKQAPELFEVLLRDKIENEVDEPFFFGTHPAIQNRIKNYNELVADIPFYNVLIPSTNIENKLFSVKLLNTKLNMELSRYKTAKRNLDELSKFEESSKIHYLYGEYYRSMESLDNSNDLAVEHYLKSVEFDTTESALYRLGTIYFKKENKQQAKKYLKDYIKSCIDCYDKSYAEFYLNKIEN